ncbi:MAG: cob(I)yrinic acid a,c-diamide adenosyltransferase [Phycisphaerales bacterium]|nr:cob(I)yrinic acid a,c-diamide adenosyltransferase [Phycisphaerales bacterium]
MKIYTRTGDDGTTGLIGGQRLKKSDLRIESYGTIDELNAVIGLALAQLAQSEALSDEPKNQARTPLRQQLTRVQHELFAVGSNLASENPDKYAALPKLDVSMVARLEQEIDQINESLSPLRKFILPGGSLTAATLHLARTVCRRAERLIVGLAESQPINPVIITYVNRLADWLFIQARAANHIEQVAEPLWEK